LFPGSAQRIPDLTGLLPDLDGGTAPVTLITQSVSPFAIKLRPAGSDYPFSVSSAGPETGEGNEGPMSLGSDYQYDTDIVYSRSGNL